jgi:hypothetical protein
MKSQIKNIILYLILYCTLCCLFSCKKLVDIPPPVSTITTSQVFATDDQAESAMAGIYYGMINSVNPSPFCGGVTINAGMSADEFICFNGTDETSLQFQNNTLLSTNGNVTQIWNNAYSTLYGCNAVIEGLQSTKTVDDSTKTELTGEAEFIRAFANFYLVNLFGDPTLVTTINYQDTRLLKNSTSAVIYSNIVADLKDASSKLAIDFSAGHGQRIVPNKWAAIALLARVYLYLGDWQDAETLSASVINNSALFSLSPLTGPSEVFSINSTETIWQLQQSNENGPSFNATPEGYVLIPSDSTSQPQYVYLTQNLLSAFEKGDMRRFAWVDSTNYLGIKYYYPYKYKVGISQQTVGGPYTEYYMVLRLAEQYLIRAEAEAHLGDVGNAANDLDIIRNRAGLTNTTASGQTELLAAIAHENQIEFFAEWGHRWLDLKRTGEALTVLKLLKPKLTLNGLIYPIPPGDISADPNLRQNPGYQ